MTESLVERIILEKQLSGAFAAKGVSFVHNGVQQFQTAKKEVILCTGAFESPQLLEISGIGHPIILHNHNVEVLLDNPYIGENLQDRPMTGILFEVIDDLATIDMVRDPQVVKRVQEAYQSSRQGPLTSSFHTIASLPIVEFLSKEGRLELQSLLDRYIGLRSPSTELSIEKQHALLRSVLESSSESSAIIDMGASQMHFDQALQKDIYAITEQENYMSFLVALAQPFSRGSVHVRSKSISDPPDIDPCYLPEPLDLEILARYMKYIPTIAATEPLAFLIKNGGRHLPDSTNLETLDSAKEYCKRNIITNNHPCGTCAVLPIDQGGLVDARLKVRDVDGLRVIDASIFPMIPRGNIQSSVYAVAERAADLIKEDWGIA